MIEPGFHDDFILHTQQDVDDLEFLTFISLNIYELSSEWFGWFNRARDVVKRRERFRAEYLKEDAHLIKTSLNAGLHKRGPKIEETL